MQWSKLIQKKRISNRLTVELTPASVRSKSLFQYYVKNNKIEEWTKLKRELLEKEGAKCWICGKESYHLHIHEFWNYNEQTKTATLQEIHHICDMCYILKRSDKWFFTDFGKEQLKQFGLSQHDLVKHYCRVNRCFGREFGENWQEAVDIWNDRNKINWSLDFGEYLKKNIQ